MRLVVIALVALAQVMFATPIVVGDYYAGATCASLTGYSGTLGPGPEGCAGFQPDFATRSSCSVGGTVELYSSLTCGGQPLPSNCHEVNVPPFNGAVLFCCVPSSSTVPGPQCSSK